MSDDIEIITIQLVNADNAGIIDTNLKDNTVIDLKTLPHFSMNVVPEPAELGSVQFVVDGGAPRNENHLPYSMFGDDGPGKGFWPCKLPQGKHTVVITPFSGPNATGTKGESRTLNFTITDSSAPAKAISNVSVMYSDGSQIAVTKPVASVEVLYSDGSKQVVKA